MRKCTLIKSYKSKALKLLATKRDKSKIDQRYVNKIDNILTILDASECIDDFDFPGGDLHPFKERDPIVWSLKVSANDRITFIFDGKDVYDVNYLDTH
jgi:proteic killer suppression protein